MSELLYLKSSAALSPEEKGEARREGWEEKGGSETACRSHLEDLQWLAATEDKAIRLGSPDSKVY